MNEELEKIAQDMRKKERELWAGNPPRMGNGAIALMLDGYASRLEVALGLAPRPKGKAAAAAKHEMAKEMSKKLDGNRAITGNGAALRKALESMCENLAMHIQCGRFVAPGDHVSFPISEAEAYIRDIQAALAAPARNCDRYRTEKEAEAAFDRFCAKERNGQCKPWECPLKSTGGKYCYVAWLLGTEDGAE